MAIAIKDFRMAIRIDNSEAKQSLVELKDRISLLKGELNELDKAGQKETEAYREKKKVLDELNAKYTEQRKVVGLTGLTYAELRKGARSLRAQLDNTVPGTEKYKVLQADLRITEARMKELKGTAIQTRFSISKLADGFNKYAAVGASTIATMTGIALTARKCVDEFAEMQESESQVRKYTGMTTEKVAELNEEFKKMDTRTARTRLNELAGDAGKLGITSKKDVLEFIDAANMINVALGDDLGEDAVKNIGKLAQMFGEDKNLGLRGAMLATGSAINEVAQNSSAAEAYLVGFTARVAGAANQAKIAQGDIIGYASVLDQNMQQQEMAATAFQTLMLKMFQSPAKFAKMAGENVKDFTRLIKTDANEAILQFLETLNKKGGLDQLAPMFKEMGLDGVRASGVLSTMAGKINDIRSAQKLSNQAYRDGTSAINEYNIQNNTVQAQLDKAKKRFADIRIELGEKLLPYMGKAISTSKMMVNVLSILVGFLIEHSRTISSLITAIAAYTIVTKAATIAQSIYNNVIKTGTVTFKAFSAAIKANPLGLIASAVAGVISYFTLFRTKTEEVTSSQKKLNAELERTKETMDLISGVKVNAENFQFLTDKQKQQLKFDAQKSIDDLDDLITKGMIANKQWYESEKTSLIKAAGDNEVLKKSYLSGLEHDLQSRMEVIAGYLDKKKELEKVVSMVPDETDTNANGGSGDDPDDKKPWNKRLQAAENGHNQELLLLRKSSDAQAQTEKEYQLDALQKEVEYQVKRLSIIKQYQSSKISKENAAELGKLENDARDSAYSALKQSEEARLNLLKEYRDRRIETIVKGEKESQVALSKEYENGKLSEKEYKNQSLAIEVAASASRLAVIQDYQDDVIELEFQNGEIKAEAVKEAGNEILQAEKEISEKRAKIISDSASQIEKFNSSYDKTNSNASKASQLNALKLFYDSQVKLAKKNGLDITQLTQVYEEAKKQIEEKGAKDRAEVVKKYSLGSAEENKNLRLSALEEEHKKGLLSEEEYEGAKNKIFNDHLKEKIQANQQYFEAFNSVMSNMSSAVQGFQDAEVAKVEHSYDKKITAAKKAGKDTTKLEEEKEEAVAEVKKKYASMQFALNVMQTISSTAMAAMLAYASLAGIPVVGPALGAAAAAAAIAAGAAQIAVAKQQKDEAMGLKSGGYSDDYVQGYTSSGNPDDVAGAIPVHKNEFVANHEAVANPHVRQFLDVFNVAQRNGTVRMINTTQILEQVRTKSGKYSGGYVVDETKSENNSTALIGQGTGTDISLVLKLLQKCVDLLGIISVKDLKVNARDMRDEIKRIEQLEKNVNR